MLIYQTAVTREQLDESIKAHNVDINGHRDAFNKKLDVSSNQYTKALAKHNQGLQVTKVITRKKLLTLLLLIITIAILIKCLT